MSFDLEDQPDLDTATALADISTDLFGQGGESEDAGAHDRVDAGVEETPGKPSPVEAPPSQQPAEEAARPEAATATAEASTEQPTNSEAVQELGAPKTWTKEALEKWATVDPRIQQEILKREEDFLRGITQYKDRADLGTRYDSVVEPYKPLLVAENLDPVQMFQSFAANHYILSKGTEDQKVQLAANLVTAYGVDFAKLITFIGEQTPVDPELQALRQEVAELKNANQSRQQQDQEALRGRLDLEIKAFSEDPANPYFNELVDDIAKLFETGQASDLKDAYDKAVYLNPVTRQKEIDRLTAVKSMTKSAEELAREAKIAAAQAADVSVGSKAKNGTVLVGSIDDTLRETMAQIANRA